MKAIKDTKGVINGKSYEYKKGDTVPKSFALKFPELVEANKVKSNEKEGAK